MGLDDVASLMRANLPDGLTPRQFGEEIMRWGKGNAAARDRVDTITFEELNKAGVTVEMAENWALAYQSVMHLMPSNPSAAGRAELMFQAAKLLRGE